MEYFFKKYGFDAKKKNHRNRHFHIVRYYPKIQTYEFINVGIILYDKNEVFYRFLQVDEISKLHCPSLIESKVLKNSLNSLDEYMQGQQKLNVVVKDISKRYKNILDTSFQLVYNGDEDPVALVDKLFYDYIGYKFDSEEKESKLSRLINQTETIISKKFKRYLKVKKSKIHGYSLDFLNEQTKTIHHSLLGSIENSENVARAFLHVPLQISQNNAYDFLNIKAKISDAGINNREKLSKLNIGIYNYSSEEDIANYCERLIS